MSSIDLQPQVMCVSAKSKICLSRSCRSLGCRIPRHPISPCEKQISVIRGDVGLGFEVSGGEQNKHHFETLSRAMAFFG